MADMGTPNRGGMGSIPAVDSPGGNNGVPRTESLKRTLLRDTFGSKEAWGRSASGVTDAVKDSWGKSGYRPMPDVSQVPQTSKFLRLATAGAKVATGAGAIYGIGSAVNNLSKGNYADAGLDGADAVAAGLALTPAAPAALLYGAGRAGQTIGSAIGENLSNDTKDTIGGTINQGVRSLGKTFGQDWGVDDSAYLAQKAETRLRNPQPTASVATQPRPSRPQAAANPALPAANTQPIPPAANTPTNTLRGLPGTDMGGGISKFVQGGRTLFSNVQGGDNDTLMNRGPTSAQNQRAMDGIQLRQDQGDAAYAAKRQYDSEVADATALRGGGTDLASRIARQGPNHAVASMLADQQNKTALRGQDIMREGHFLTDDVAKANARYQMNKDKRDFDVGRSDHADLRGDKNFEQRQQATKDLHTEIGNMLPPGADGKPDLATASRYATGLTAHVAGVADSYRKRAAAEPNNPAVRDWLDTAKHLDAEGPKALDATAKQRLMAGMQAKDTETANHSGLNPFGGTAVQTNAPVTSLKLKPGVFSDDYISTHADGSQGKIPRRKIDGGWFEPANASYDSLKVK